MTDEPALVGLVLAAGAGSRFGGPKALARTADGTPWLLLAVRALHAGGCGRVVVALGAGAEHAEALLAGLDHDPGNDAGVEPVVVHGWAAGLSASLRAGLASAFAGPGDAVVVVTVDTPALPATAVRRTVQAVRATGPALTGALARATYAGAPGHPVLVGRDHAATLAASVTGDAGAGAYLRAHGAQDVPCEDLWDGVDVDRRPR